MADSKKVAVAGGKDRFQDLPEHVLELLLSFLDARNVVRTSVLGRRWRNLWKSVPVLRFRPSSTFGCAENFNNFVNKVLECRDQTSPIRECHIHSYLDGEEDETHRHVESWVRYAVSCQVSVLRVLMWGDDHCNLKLPNNSVISRHLTDLALYRVDFDERPLDLLSCQALEVLDIACCCINLGDILPKSLRHLRIVHSTLLSMHTPRNCLSAPGLVTFELQHCEGWTPLLESLPSLVTASIIIGFVCKDNCDQLKYLGDCGVESCQGCYVEDDCSVLLEGLSGATNLKMISKYSMIFRKDLKWCPMFSKLKVVFLNEWCLTANFTGLLHFLQHSPILEKLTLKLSYHKKFDIESSESYNPSEYFLVSKHLKVVEIHDCWEDKKNCRIVKILGAHGVIPAQIKHFGRLPPSVSSARS